MSPIPVPYIVYGTVTNSSTSAAIAGASIYSSGATTTTNPVGKYQLNIMDVASSGSTKVTATYAGCSTISTFTLKPKDASKLLNFSITIIKTLSLMNTGRLTFYGGSDELKFITE